MSDVLVKFCKCRQTHHKINQVTVIQAARSIFISLQDCSEGIGRNVVVIH